MYYAIRTSPGYLALVNSDTDMLVRISGQKIALPDVGFWAVIRAKGYYDTMIADPIGAARMARVEGAVGVGVLRGEKNCVSRAGLTNANAHTLTPPGEFEEG